MLNKTILSTYGSQFGTTSYDLYVFLQIILITVVFSAARSPLTGHLNSTLEGLITIRSSNAQEIVTNEFDRHQDLFTSALFMVISNFAGLAIFLEYISIVFTSLIIFQLLLTDTGKFNKTCRSSKLDLFFYRL